LDPFFHSDCFNGKDVERDSSLVPYFLSSNKIYGYTYDSTGVVKHYSSTSDNIWVDVPDNYTLIFWYLHKKVDSLDPRPLYSYGGYISYDTLGFEKITIDNREAWRIRGKWWEVQCDGTIQVSGSFTNYYIPTKKWDFRITCLSCFYSYERTPLPCDAPPEVCDSLIKAIYGKEGWKSVRTWPDRIAELERAVEQTFRVKE